MDGGAWVSPCQLSVCSDMAKGQKKISSFLATSHIGRLVFWLCSPVIWRGFFSKFVKTKIIFGANYLIGQKKISSILATSNIGRLVWWLCSLVIWQVVFLKFVKSKNYWPILSLWYVGICGFKETQLWILQAKVLSKSNNETTNPENSWHF